LRAIAGWPFLAIGIYMTCALLGSLIPANARWRQPSNGIEIFVETNGVHVSIILPISAVGSDLSDLIKPEDLSDPALFGSHAMIGWGHSAVYRNTKTWADVRSGDIASAVTGSNETTLHIYHLINPKTTVYRKAIRISPDQYRLIVRDVRAAFRLDQTGHSTAYPAYAANNLFYDSTGYYSALHTCNNWTADVLRHAGIRIGIWTPMAGGVMRWF
jgi:uncharacterized protein (TIGR02117 family)